MPRITLPCHAALFAFLCLALCVVVPHAHAADTTPPVIASASITPTGMFPVLHAPIITITATVTAKNHVGDVKAKIYEDGAYNGNNLTFLGNGGSGSKFTGTYDLSIFFSDHSMPHTYTVQIVASDRNGNTATLLADGSVVVKADDALPVVTNTFLAPTGSFGATEAPLATVSATVTDPGADATGVGLVYATLYRDGVEQAYPYSILLSNGGAGDVYTGTFDLTNFGPNNTTRQHVYTVQIEAHDNAGEATTVFADGSITVDNDRDAFPIGAMHLAPLGPFPAGEPPRRTSLTAAANFPGGVRRVSFDVYRDGARLSADNVFLHMHGDSLYFNYPLSLSYFPLNTTDAPWVYTFKVRATGNDGQSVSANIPGCIIILNDNHPPVLSDFHVSPGGTYAANAMVTYTLTAHASDTGTGGAKRRLRSVTVRFDAGAHGTGVVTLPQVGTTLYRRTLTFQAYNNSVAPYVYSFKATATDLAGTVVHRMAPETITVMNDNTPPIITDAHISPTGTFSPLAAPTITISAHVRDAGVGVNSVGAVVSSPGTIPHSITLISSGGDLYTATDNLQLGNPPSAPAPYVYTASIYAADNFNNSGTTPASGTVTILTDSHDPVVSHFTVSPQFIPNAGGTVRVQATVTDNGPNDTGLRTVSASVSHDGQYQSLTLTPQGNVYAGTFTVPAGDAVTHFYTVFLFVQDNAYNGLSPQRGAVQEGTATQPVPTLSSLTPDNTFSLTPIAVTATGTGFTPASVAVVGGQLFPTTYVSPTQVTIDFRLPLLFPSVLARPHTVDIQIANPPPAGGTSNALPFTVTPGVKSVTLAPASVVSGQTATGTVILEAPAPIAETITLSTSDPAFAVVPASVTVTAGQKSTTFSIATPPLQGYHSVIISANGGNTGATASLTITPASH